MSTTPPSYTAPIDLTDSEFSSLDEAFIDAPEPLRLLDGVMLDGFLAGVLVQPRLIDSSEWLRAAFEAEDGEEAEGEEAGASSRSLLDSAPEWAEQVVPLVVRRHAALNRKIVEEGSFDPFILEVDEDVEAQDTEGAEAASPDEDDELAKLPPVSQALAPWVYGFQLACLKFESLLDSTDDAVMLALARLFRHLPPEDEQMADLVATMNQESPLDTIDEAIDDLVACVVDLSDLTHDDRYHVETVRRAAPKVGRNEPCPCGSGKKFKQCHGKTASA